jgi:hypothetical protein
MGDPGGGSRAGLGLAGLVVALGGAAWAAFNLAPPAVADVAIVPYAVILLLGPVFVYSRSRRAGSAGRGALALAMIVPVLWLAKELWRVSGVFPIAQTAYYAFSPISMGVFCAAAGSIAIAEIVLRRAGGEGLRLRGAPGVTLGVILLLAIGAAAVGYESGGREIFYGYIALYGKLFPGG